MSTLAIEENLLRKIHRDLDACQRVIWLAGGFDPAYCSHAQDSLRQIEAVLAAQTPEPEPAND